MTNYRLKRKAIELKSFEMWLTRGRGGFHIENSKLFANLVKGALWLTGIKKKGEQNALKANIKKIYFELNRLPTSFSPFTILHLSDLHIDGLFGLTENICEMIKDIEVDLCVMTGDYRFETYGPCHNVYDNMKKIVSTIKARHGIIGILGNHDYAEESVEFEKMGIKMLINDSLEIRIGNENVWVVGVDDPHYYGCDDLEKALKEVPESACKILLVHSPEIVEDAENKNIDLYLCGHTHAGQICVPFLGPVIINANCKRKFASGVWQFKNLKGFTSAGIGSSCVPVRFFCPPEIGIIELRTGKEIS